MRLIKLWYYLNLYSGIYLDVLPLYLNPGLYGCGHFHYQGYDVVISGEGYKNGDILISEKELRTNTCLQKYCYPRVEKFLSHRLLVIDNSLPSMSCANTRLPYNICLDPWSVEVDNIVISPKDTLFSAHCHGIIIRSNLKTIKRFKELINQGLGRKILD